MYNCMSLKKQTGCISYYNWSTGIGIWNELTPQLICQYLIVPSQQFKIVMQKAVFLHFHQVACGKLAGHL